MKYVLKSISFCVCKSIWDSEKFYIKGNEDVLECVGRNIWGPLRDLMLFSGWDCWDCAKKTIMDSVDDSIEDSVRHLVRESIRDIINEI